MVKKIKWESKHIEVDELGKMFYPEDKESDYKEEDEFGDGFEMVKPRKIMNTAFGLFEIDDKFNPFRQFKIWKAYTNFDVTEELLEKIDKVEGVEILYPFSRYSFFVGVAELFEFSEVRVLINNVCGLDDSKFDFTIIEDLDCRKRTQDFVQHLKTTSTEWSIFVFPNGNIDYTESGNLDFLDKKEAFKKLEEEIQGIYIDSNHVK